MSPRTKPDLRIVDPRPSSPQNDDLLRQLLIEHDQAEALVRKTKELIRPLARRWADNRNQFTMPSLDQLRREYGL